MDDEDYQEPHADASDDPAAAFERLRGEVSLLRSAIEGLTAARESIDIPDYEPTLARTEKVLTVLAEQLGLLRQSPAMTLTPENMSARLNAAVADSMNTLRSHAQASKSALDGTVNDLRSIIRSARHADEQDRRVYLFGGGGLVLGLLLYAVLAGPIARLAPVNWQWPERVATRVLAERTAWDAGQHLMASSSRESWTAIVAADRLIRDNRETIDGCREQAAKAKKAVRCTVDVKAQE